MYIDRDYGQYFALCDIKQTFRLLHWHLFSYNFCSRVYLEDPPLRRLRGRKGVLALSVASKRAGSQRETKSEI